MTLTSTADDMEFEPLLAWRKSKVMLFADYNKDAYDVAKNSNWQAFLLSGNLNIDRFVNTLEKE